MTKFKVGDIVVYHTVPVMRASHLLGSVWVVTDVVTDDGDVRIEPLFGDTRDMAYRHTSSHFVEKLINDASTEVQNR
jgi:hypothetical protein